MSVARRPGLVRAAAALAGALGLHAVVLLLAQGVRVPAAAPLPAAQHEWVELSVVAAVSPPPAADAPAQSARPAPRARRPVQPSRAPAVTEPAPPAPQPSGAAPTLAAPTSSEGAPVPVGASEALLGDAPESSSGGTHVGVASSAAGGAGTGAEARGGGAGEGDGSLAALQQRLADAARRCYPRAAARFRAEGTSRIRFCVDGGGQLAERALLESAGTALLDDAAVGCVLDRAAPFPPLGRCLTLPVQFRLAR